MISQSNALQSTTQKYLELFDITNDVLILQDGTVSMVLQSSAINFDLYSEEEQDAAIYAYAALLNSLSFPIEIVIRSQKKDVTSYLDLLKNAEVKAYNPVNKKNIRQYRQFVEELVQERNILEKKFYIIVSYTALEAGLLPGSSLIPGMSKKTAKVLDKASILERALTNLAPRRDHLAHQFARIGLFVNQIKTQELIQLYYTIYNPDSAKGIRVGEATEYTSPLVEGDLPPQELVKAVVPTAPLPSAGSTAPTAPPNIPNTQTSTIPTSPSIASSFAPIPSAPQSLSEEPVLPAAPTAPPKITEPASSSTLTPPTPPAQGTEASQGS